MNKQGKRSKKKHLSKEAFRKITYEQNMWRVYKHTLSLSVSHSPCRAVDILPQCFLFWFFCHICHSLSSAIRLAAGSPPSVHRPTLSLHAVLLLPGKHFPSISPSVTAITSPSLLLFQCPYLANFRFFSCSSSPFCSGTPIFCRNQTFGLVFSPADTQHTSPAPQFKRRNPFFVALLHRPAFRSI